MSKESIAVPIGKYFEIWKNIEYKAHKGGRDLTSEEREEIMERIIDDFADDLRQKSDEGLLEILLEKGLV